MYAKPLAAYVLRVRMTLPLLLLVAGHAAAEVLTVIQRPQSTLPRIAMKIPPMATLRLIPESTLPGIPVSFLITITNPTGQVLTLGDVMTLKATTDAGTFDVLDFMRKEVALPSEGVDQCGSAPCLHIAANGQRDLLVDVGPMLLENAFFLDPRLMKPGTYDLELTLYDLDRWFEEEAAIRTNAARMTVRQPTGVDLEVWNLMKKAVAPSDWVLESWMGSDAAREIQTRFPASTYFPYVVSLASLMALPGAFTGDVSAFDKALAMNPPVTLRDTLLLHKAGLLAGRSESVLRCFRDVDQTVLLANAARDVFLELQRVAISELMRQRAADGLSRLYTRDMALRQILDDASTAPSAPSPR
jgi:hypothetical protein